MSDTQVSITFGGEVAGFQAACQSAQAAMQALTGTVTAMTSGLQAATQGLQAATPATAALNSALQQTATAARTNASNLSDLVNSVTGVSRETRSAAASADVFRTSLGDATNEVKDLRARMNEVPAAAGRAGHATGGVTRELLVLGHEAMMGNFSRFGGSLIVMAELMGNVSMGALAMGGAVALAGVAVYHIIQNFREAAHEAAALNAQMVLMGRDPEAATAQAKALADQLHQVDGVGSTAARHIAEEFMKLHSTLPEMQTQLALLVPALAAANSTESIEKVSEAFARQVQTISGIKHLFEELSLYSKDGGAAERDKLEHTNSLLAAQELLYERLKARTADFQASKERAAAAARDANISGLPDGPQGAPPAPLKMSDAARSPQDQETDEIIAKANERKTEALELDRQMLDVEQRIATTNDAADKASAQSALVSLQEKKAALVEAGDVGWAQKQEAAIAQVMAASVRSDMTSRQAAEAKLQAEVDFWTKAASGANLSALQRTEAETRLARATEQLTMERIRAKEAADRSGVASTRKSVQEQISELSAQQAASREDYETWVSLEGQKLAILRTAYGEKSQQFQAELKSEETYQREHQAKIEQEELSSLERQRQLGQKKLAETVSNLQEEEAAEQRTKSEVLQLQFEATAEEGKAQLQALDGLITSLATGTTEYRKAMEQRATVAQDFQSKLARIQTQMTAEDSRATQQSLRNYTQVFDSIGSRAQSMATGLIDGTMTWRRAEQQATSAIMQGIVQLATQALARWAAFEIGKTLTTEQQAAIRTQQQNGETGFAVIGRALAAWIGFEGSKTTATVGQAGLREAADTTAAGTSAVDGSVAALAQIKAQAAAAAAGAYAATAAIPYVGPGLAPEAAATAFAGAMSFAGAVAVPSFAVGAWNLPTDMLAQVHKGEMIVPAFQAEAARNGGLGGGGGDVHLHVNAVDAKSFTSMFAGNISTIARQLKAFQRLNPSTT